MTMHLRARVAGYRLLIPTSSVLEVWDEAPPPARHVTWRGRDLPYVDGGALFGGHAASARVLIAYGRSADDPAAAILGVDEIAGAVAIQPSALKPFPTALSRAHLFFDGVAEVSGEVAGEIRLRDGLDLAAMTAGR